MLLVILSCVRLVGGLHVVPRSGAVAARAPHVTLLAEPDGIDEAVLVSVEGAGWDDEGAAESLRGIAAADARALLAAAGVSEQLSLTLCDDEFIRELNQRWRGVDRPTDVLSFPMEDEQLLGDVVISVPTAERQASERAYGLRDELRVLLVHGVLHLMGYDHALGDSDHADHMDAEQTLLRRLGWEGDGLIGAAGAKGVEP